MAPETTFDHRKVIFSWGKETKGPHSKASHGRILISWNPIWYTFLCTKIKKLIKLPTQVCNNIKQCSLLVDHLTTSFSAHTASHTEEEVSSIQALSTRPAPCGSFVLWLVTRPWRSFWTRHGGARGRRRRGKPWVSGEEHQEGGVQSCSPLTWWTRTRERESVKERVNGLLFRFSGRS